MRLIRSCLLIAGGLALFARTGQAAVSLYKTTTSDQNVSTTPVRLLTATVTFDGGTIFVHSDGNYHTLNPNDNKVVARVFILLDGKQVSNDSIIDWDGGNKSPAQHSFNVFGAPSAAAGTHTVELWAVSQYGTFVVLATANLSVMPNPAPLVDEKWLPIDIPNGGGAFDFPTINLQHPLDAPTPPMLPSIPHLPVLTSDAHDFNGQPVIALASGRSYLGGQRTCSFPVNRCGDAMWGLFIAPTSQCGSSNPDPLCSQSGLTSAWTINDLFDGAEMQAPMFCQAYYPANHPALSGGRHQISLDASEFPWLPSQGGPDHHGEDPVQYRIGGTTRLLLLSGMEISGRAVSSQSPPNNTEDVLEVGLPTHGAEVPITAGTFTIPAKKLGVIFFAAKVRVFPPGEKNGNGFAKIWFTIERSNGTRNPPIVARSPVGSQQTVFDESARTISTSYLATDDTALVAGDYVVRLWGQTTGVFAPPGHVGLTRDLPLLWFGHTFTPCVPSTCQAGNCGVMANGCGGTITCGGCSAPMVCGGNPKTPSVCACRAFTCPAGNAGDRCGAIRDDCGHTFQCPCQHLLQCLATNNPGASVCYIP